VKKKKGKRKYAKKKGKGKGSEGKSEHGVVFCFTRTVLHVLYKEEVESIPKNVVLV
jgi:hypothetical protein